MNNANVLFDFMRLNIDHAQKHFNTSDFNNVDYFLGLLSKDITAVRKMYGRKPAEPAKLLKREYHEFSKHEPRSP